MQLVESNQLSDLKMIYSDDVELVSIARTNSTTVQELSQRLLELRTPLKLQWKQTLKDRETADSQLPESIDIELRTMLVDLIGESCEIFGELMGCSQIGVRLATLRSPMCPRFHVDQIPCRMIITMVGTGTEWIPNTGVNWSDFSDLSNDKAPLNDSGKIQQLETGNWSILKGGARGYQGLVHRSPHDYSERLLLSLDPISE
ncbi:MAG: DUF1826 domain-containing protein [Candidatus Azotimanducaceae bacterium]